MKNLRGRYHLVSMASAVVFWGMPIATGAMVIDDFNHGPLALSPTNYSPALVEVQTDLPPASTLGGMRRVTARSQEQALLEIDPGADVLAFEALAGHGYFTLEYGSASPLGIDLRAGGDDAFLLQFSQLHVPGLYRGIYDFYINGDYANAYSLLPDLAALGGAGDIRIPFSVFSSDAAFVVDRITIDAARVEEGYSLVLDSIRTVPEPATGLLLLLGAAAGRAARRLSGERTGCGGAGPA